MPSRRCSTIPTPTCAAARSTCSISSGPRAVSARGRPSRTPIRRCASPPTAPCGAPVSTCCRWPRVSPATPTPASAARSRCRCATSRPTTSLDILVDIARGFDGQDRSYLEALGTGATGKEPALYDRLQRELGVKDDPLAWPAGVHVDRVAAARAGGGRRPDRARAVVEAVARRPPLRARYARVHQRPGRVEGDARASREPNSPLREPATWWLLNRMSERLGGLRPARRRSRRPASTIPTRSR